MMQRFVAMVAVAVASLATGGVAWGQTAYTQNFDTLPANGAAVTFTTIAPPGVFAIRQNGDATLSASSGGSTGGGLYSLGAADATDRALGSLGSSTVGTLGYGFQFQNTGATAISSVTVGYTGEQWRKGGKTTPETLSFSYNIASSLPTPTQLAASAGTVTKEGDVPTGYTAVAALNFMSPNNTSGATALDGNATANRTIVAPVTINFATPIAAGQYLTLYFADPDSPGAEHILSIDDFTLSSLGTLATAPVPEPATVLACSAAVLAGAGVLRRRRKPAAA